MRWNIRPRNWDEFRDKTLGLLCPLFLFRLSHWLKLTEDVDCLITIVLKSGTDSRALTTIALNYRPSAHDSRPRPSGFFQ